ncbi:putative transcriptional regulator [Rhodovulum sp. PH10]|uniref:GntR family transcriptional regulator n=1 Tax=Rhodovulum sp. PH10 TaxID=1187851 RepID=UPI00027C263F|nr:FCD domain-containing protein [Rhodovulum sp. PH10]EJW12114.1 putative transcriptional regulator [Rhodovulum sp. PH10]
MAEKTFEHMSRRAGETLASATYVQLRHDIMNGALPPGSPLRIRQLCERYAVGFSPIREALNRLLRDRLVRQVDLRGFVVAPLSKDELEEITKTRCWVNEIALRESITNGDSAWEEQVVIAFHRLSRVPVDPPEGTDALENGVNPAYETAHRHFHATLIGACGSDLLLDFCEQLFDVADRYRRLRTPSARQQRQRDEHRLIMEATIERDTERAVELLRGHLMKTAELAYGALGDAGSEASPRSASDRDPIGTPPIVPVTAKP